MIPTPGTRIELVHTTDPYTRLRPGAQGTVTGGQSVQGYHTVWVAWDDGSTLGLVDGEDRWRVVTPA